MKRLSSMTVILLISMAVVILVGSTHIGTVSADVSQAQLIAASTSPTPSTSPNLKPSDSAEQKPGEPNPTCSPNDNLAWLSWPFLGGFYAFALIYVLIQLSGWKLSDALSEQIENEAGKQLATSVSTLATSVSKLATSVSTLTEANREPLKDISSKLTEVGQQLKDATKPQLVPSASRLIAFIGAIVLGGVLFTSSFYIVWALFNCQPMKPLSDLGSYLTACAALFAPYVANKVSDILKPLSKPSGQSAPK